LILGLVKVEILRDGGQQIYLNGSILKINLEIIGFPVGLD
jgi:hypothetical protein